MIIGVPYIYRWSSGVSMCFNLSVRVVNCEENILKECNAGRNKHINLLLFSHSLCNILHDVRYLVGKNWHVYNTYIEYWSNFASRRLMKHDLKANRHTCLSIVADPKMTTWQGIASNLAFGLEGLHHELGSKFFKELSVMRYPITINCTI